MDRNRSVSGEHPPGDSAPETDAALEASLRTFHDWCHAEGGRSVAFWDAQRRAVGAKLADRASQPTMDRRWVALAVAAAIVLCVALVAARRDVPAPAASTEADQELLVGIERSLDRELPRALEPVSLITAELDRAAEESAAPASSNHRIKRGS